MDLVNCLLILQVEDPPLQLLFPVLFGRRFSNTSGSAGIGAGNRCVNGGSGPGDKLESSWLHQTNPWEEFCYGVLLTSMDIPEPLERPEIYDAFCISRDKMTWGRKPKGLAAYYPELERGKRRNGSWYGLHQNVRQRAAGIPVWSTKDRVLKNMHVRERRAGPSSSGALNHKTIQE